MRRPKVIPIDPAEVKTLIDELDRYQQQLYPAESNHLETIEQLQTSNALMFGAVLDDEVVAIGAVKFMADYGEVKRLYVPPRHRGRGLATAIMARIEAEIIAQGLGLARLETGIYQPEAIALYERLGYVRRAPFGNYVTDPLSIFLEKKLP